MPFNHRGRDHNKEGPEARSVLGSHTLYAQRELPLAPGPLSLFFVLRALKYRDKVSIETGPYPLKRSKKRGLLFSPLLD